MTAPASRLFFSFVLALAALVSVAPAAPPSEPAAKAAVIGQPVALIAQPEAIVLTGPRSVQQVLITGRYADGTRCDLTCFCDWSCEGAAVIEVQGNGLVVPRGDGAATLVVRAGEQTLRLPVEVKSCIQPEPVSFRREMMAALSVGGCNGGSCHGIPSGRNGFRLSLWGQHPAFDHAQLTRDALGRRTNPLRPESSLIYQKAIGAVPHEGGRRFAPESLAAHIVRDWQADGLHDDPADLPALQRLEVLPNGPVIRAPGRWQQLAVRAHFADGAARDVSRLTVFTSSDRSVADVSADGLVEFYRRGEVAILCRYLGQRQAVRLTYQETPPGFRWPDPPEHNYVDRHVFAKLKLLDVTPSDVCTDQEFQRRVFLDVCGVLPRPEEAKAFLASADPGKRAKLIDALLERPEYADFWAMKWADVLRIDRNTIQLPGAQAYHGWLRTQLASNQPFDQVVRTMLTAVGHSHKDGPANFYAVARGNTKEAPQALAEDLAESVAQLFLGVRLQCARCHNHPYERWTQDDYYGLTGFFAAVKQDREGPPGKAGRRDLRPVVVSLDAKAREVIRPDTHKPAAAHFIGGAAAVIPDGADRRQVFADWLTRGDNPFFARALVNRAWTHLLGRGIVDPVDDFRDSNPSANDELLDALAKDFVAHTFDVKHIIRTVCNSRTYQLSARADATNADDVKYFARAATKLLPAEVLLDAICAATAVPETYPGFSAGTRAVQLPDTNVVNQNAEYPGWERPAFLLAMGAPARQQACECERETALSLAQVLELLNGPTIAAKLDRADNRLGRLLAQKTADADILNELYLVTLSRPPSPAAARALLAHVAQAADKRKAWEDVLWTLLRSREFLFRH